MTTLAPRAAQPKESPMTTTTPETTTVSTPTNPYRIPAIITGWGVVAVFIGALWGAGHNPEHAEWSAFALVAIIAVYAYNKIRATAFNRYSNR
jgi:hypothetical protein